MRICYIAAFQGSRGLRGQLMGHQRRHLRASVEELTALSDLWCARFLCAQKNEGMGG